MTAGLMACREEKPAVIDRRYSVALLSVAIVQHRDDGAAPLVFTNPVKRLPEDSLVNQRIVVSILALGCQV